ncbi:hypothetical protein BT93_J1968 [Corymbia citriodora subsp. variegata]|nr:hypothetical protein BT93_J1968 [Corymbia citriodora subsp. variegata]
MEDGAATKAASTSAPQETNCPSRGKEGRPSLNSLALARKAIPQTDISHNDIEEWRRAVYEGKFWVHENLHKNCFLVLPKACDIAGDDEESCWSWITKEEKWFSFRSIVDIPVPKLEKESPLLIQGRFKTRALSPNTMYEVAFVVQLITSYVTAPSLAQLELVLPDGTKQTRKEDLNSRSGYEWINLCAGEFMMGPKTVGTIIFALQWRLDPKRTGFILKGVRIHPKD